MMINNLTQNTMIAKKEIIANSILKKILGLITYKLDKKEAFIIPTQHIHTFFMSTIIDVIFIDKNKEVIALYANLKPWKLTKLHLKAKFAIELNPESIKESKTSLGDKLEICTN